MTETTVDLDTKRETPSANGHNADWQTFDDDQALLRYILEQEPLEEIVPIPEWHTKVLCRELDAEARVEIEAKAYDKKTKTTDYRRMFPLIAIRGSFNPTTGNLFFTDAHEKTLKRRGGPCVLLAMTILRLSGMLAGDGERAKKN